MDVRFFPPTRVGARDDRAKPNGPAWIGSKMRSVGFWTHGQERYHRDARRAERTEVIRAEGLLSERPGVDPAPTIGFSFGGSATIRMEANGSVAWARARRRLPPAEGHEMTQDTRKDPRAKIVSLNVRYKSATVDEFIDNHSHDVSKGGIFIKTPSPFPPGTLLKFEIRIAGDKAVIAGVGRVVWKREPAQSNAEQPAGMGVKFIKIDDPSRAIIDRLVDTKGGASSAYEEGGGDSMAGPPPLPDPPAPGAFAKEPRKVAPKPASVVAARAPAAEPKPQPAPARSPSLNPPGGKPTMMGLGSVSGAVSKAPAAPTPAAGRPAGDDARKHTPHGGIGAPRPATSAGGTRPGALPASHDAGVMFPKTNSQGDMPPTGDQTVMKQAAELLEEALRGAGGSMDEIGQNPLFDQVSSKTKDAESAATLAKLKEPSAPEKPTALDAGPTDVDDLMRPIPELERAAAAERIRRSSSPPAISPNASTLASATRGPTPTAPKASTRPPSAVDAVGDAPSKNRWILPVLLAAAAGGLGFFVYTQMHAVPASDSAVTPPAPPSASASATPSAQPSASAAAAASASAEPGADSAIDAATDAATDAADAADGAKAAAAPAAARPASPPRPRKPAATPATDDDNDNAPPAAASTSGSAAGTPTSGATPGTDTTPAAAPTATTPKPAAKKPKSDDDNPY